MLDEYNRNFNGLISALGAIEAQEKMRYDDAIDIEDKAEFTAVTNDARAKIIKIRKLIEGFNLINQEVAKLFNQADSSKPKEIDEERPQSAQQAIQEKDSEAPAEPAEITESAATEAIGFTLLGKPYQVPGLAELVEAFCEAIILKKPHKFAKLAVAKDSEKQIKTAICIDEQKVPKPHIRLSNGMYVYAGGQAAEIELRCRRILNECGYDDCELQL